jgi:glutathione S-transferase
MSELIIWTCDWVPEGPRGFVRDYVTRVTDRPSFKKARADQLAHFAAADASRS